MILMVGFFVAFFKSSSVFALGAEETQNGDTLHSAILTYDGDTVDLYRNAYIVSIVDQKDLYLRKR